MAVQKSGNRHPLLVYKRSLNRIWKITFLLGLALMLAWGWRWWDTQNISIFSLDTLLMAAAVMSFALSIFFFFARYMLYVRPYPKYLKLVTPFLRMKISYRRMRSVRPMLVQQIFPRDEVRRSQLNALEPFYGKTAVVIELKGFPINETWLRVLLPSTIFSPNFTGLVLIVPDWMKLSTEMDSFSGTQSRSIKDRTGEQSITWWK